jgi:hypothetical protein
MLSLLDLKAEISCLIIFLGYICVEATLTDAERPFRILKVNQIWEKAQKVFMILLSSSSCEIIALQGNFVDRPENYDLVGTKSCIFLAHEKTRTEWGIFLHSHTQPDPKQGIKKILRHFPTTLVPSLTLQISDIIHSSLLSPTLEYFAL